MLHLLIQSTRDNDYETSIFATTVFILIVANRPEAMRHIKGKKLTIALDYVATQLKTCLAENGNDDGSIRPFKIFSIITQDDHLFRLGSDLRQLNFDNVDWITVARSLLIFLM